MKTLNIFFKIIYVIVDHMMFYNVRFYNELRKKECSIDKITIQ